MMAKAYMLLAADLVGSSWGFTTEWGNGRTNDPIWDWANYASPWRVLLLLRPVVITFSCTWVEWKVATATGRERSAKNAEPIEVLSGTEQPREPETSARMEYLVQIIRGKYRSLSDSLCGAENDVIMNIREFDSIAQVIGGVEVSVSLPTVPICPRHRDSYASHVSAHTCSAPDGVEQGHRNTKEGGIPRLSVSIVWERT